MREYDYDIMRCTPPDEEDMGIVVKGFYADDEGFYADTNFGSKPIDIDELVHLVMDEDDGPVDVSGMDGQLIIHSEKGRRFKFDIYSDNEAIYAKVNDKWERL